MPLTNIIDSTTSEQIKMYLYSESTLKLETVRSVFPDVNVVQISTLNINAPDQPVNEGTARCCFQRLVATYDYLRKQNIIINENTKIVSIKNGIYQTKSKNNAGFYDVCVVMICSFNHNGDPVNVSRYNSFGVKIDNELYNIYTKSNARPLDFSGHEHNKLEIYADDLIEFGGANDSDTSEMYRNVVFLKKNEMIGYDLLSFGRFLEMLFKVPHDNWMSDPRFGNVDRRIQIRDALYKYSIDIKTDVIPDYPKQGVLFKHMTSVTVNHDLLNIMYESLERLIQNNYDLNNIDYFAGLDARGFYLAPVLARVFKKGFIPVRKANKVPVSPGQEIASESYDTEYSKDEFGLEYRPEYTITGSGSKKTVLILDDLLATGGTVVGAKRVLEKVGLKVVGAVTVYDVPSLREVAEAKLTAEGIDHKVVINNNNFPNDFTKLSYEIPEIMYKRIKFMLDKAKTPGLVSLRRYTLPPAQWLEFSELDADQLKKIDLEKMNMVRLIYTEKDKDLALKILNILADQTNADPPALDKKLRANITNEHFSNGETRIKIDANIRDMHIIIVSQIRTGSINDDLIELLLIMDACARASADKITVVMPYYPYSRSDKKDDPRSPIGAAVIAKLLSASNINNLVAIDLHAGQIQGYIDKGFHNLYIKRYMCEYIYDNYLRFTPEHAWNNEYVLIAPDAGSAKSVKGYSSILGINNIILDKQRDYSKPGTVMNSRMIGSRADLENKTGFIIDDMADTMGTMCSAAKELVENGLKDVVVFVTHGILSGEAINRINTTPYIKEVIVTDSLPQEHNIAKCPKLRVVSCAELIARSLDGILTGRSISRLF